MSKITAKIAGVGKSLPEKVVTNDDLAKIVETSDEWITQRVGIKERRIAAEGEPSSLYGARAARAALADAGMAATDIDFIIVATSTPDNAYPSTACYIQQELAAGQCAVLDVSAACSGFVYAMSVAWSMISQGVFKNVLVVGTEINSSITNWKDRSTCVLFGDGAGACVLTAHDVAGEGILACDLGGDGNHTGILKVQNSGSRPHTFEDGSKGRYITMDGGDVFKLAVRGMVDSAVRALEKAGLKKEDISLLIPHQANMRIIDAVGKRLGLGEDKVFVNIQKYGNTSAATIPIALCEAQEQGRVKKGDVVVLDAFGGGLTWGSVALRWV
jgi:3-oxoacyl-[acyl-carrier-protein] synthase-3